MITSTKHYETGFTAAFRQHKAQSHCRFLHGYGLKFTFTFGCTEPDERGWVVDFGDLDELKEELEYWFDHTVLVAVDDPLRDTFFASMQEVGLAQVRIVEKVCCEAFAELAWFVAFKHFEKADLRVRVLQVVCHENLANFASYSPGPGLD